MHPGKRPVGPGNRLAWAKCILGTSGPDSQHTFGGLRGIWERWPWQGGLQDAQGQIPNEDLLEKLHTGKVGPGPGVWPFKILKA